jgi:hypothetical protein
MPTLVSLRKTATLFPIIFFAAGFISPAHADSWSSSTNTSTTQGLTSISNNNDVLGVGLSLSTTTTTPFSNVLDLKHSYFPVGVTGAAPANRLLNTNMIYGTNVTSSFTAHKFTTSYGTGSTGNLIAFQIDASHAGTTGAMTGFRVNMTGTAPTSYAALFTGGRVGIGTTAPSGTFEIQGGTAASGAGLPLVMSAQAGASASNGGNIVINAGANGTGAVNGNILFGTGGVVGAGGVLTSGERMRIASNGNLGLGTATPLTAFHIRRDETPSAGEHDWVWMERNGTNSSTTDPWFGIGYRADGTNPTRVFLGSGNNFALDLRVTGAPQAISILNNGNVGIRNPNPLGTLDVRGGVAAAGSGLPIIVSAQTGAANSNGGNLLLNAGANGTGALNGSILFGTGATLASDGATFATGEKMRIDASGNVGIGISAPTYKLHVVGTAAIMGNSTDVTALSLRAASAVGDKVGLGFVGDGYGQYAQIVGQVTSETPDNMLANGGKLIFRTRNTGTGVADNLQDRMTIDQNGEVKVIGNFVASSIKTNTWSINTPDYVFDKGYQLSSLDHVEKYVQRNKHLPEIPSAAEMKEKGMDLAEMNLRLLKKVEELTLYSINQEKRMQQQERDLIEIKKLLKHREAR